MKHRVTAHSRRPGRNWPESDHSGVRSMPSYSPFPPTWESVCPDVSEPAEPDADPVR
jgi:hypothetical protein